MVLLLNVLETSFTFEFFNWDVFYFKDEQTFFTEEIGKEFKKHQDKNPQIIEFEIFRNLKVIELLNRTSTGSCQEGATLYTDMPQKLQKETKASSSNIIQGKRTELSNKPPLSLKETKKEVVNTIFDWILEEKSIRNYFCESLCPLCRSPCLKEVNHLGKHDTNHRPGGIT